MASICGSPVCAGGKPKLKFTYTGDYVVRKDGVVELLTSGTIVFLEPKVIDLFLVGGGGRGGFFKSGTGAQTGFGGGGGGYTATLRKVNVTGSYEVTIGAGGIAGQTNGGGGASAFGGLITANGGYGHQSSSSDLDMIRGANGGSGGGGGVSSNSDYGAGGSNGNDGERGYYPQTIIGGKGQGTTTREFGEANGKLYAGGGGGGRYISAQSPVVSAGGSGGGGTGGWCGTANTQAAAAGVANTGGGGGGGAIGNDTSVTVPGASGGSGIVCFRDAAPLPELAGTWVLNERLYAPEKDFDEITGYRFKVGTIECTRIRTSNLTHLSAFKVFSGDTVDIYTFSTNTWHTTARNLTFPAGATASDEFCAWLASNATKQA
jgi:hypothetical protein